MNAHDTPRRLKVAIDRKVGRSVIASAGNGSAYLRYWKGGRLVTLHAPKEEAYASFKPTACDSKRGNVTGFSDKSRQRLRVYLSKLRRQAPIRFLTLTYQRENVNGNDAKRDLHAFLERVRCGYPHVAAVWKLELQRRGTIHFHLLIFGGWIDHRFISRTWDRIAGNDFHGGHSTSTRIEAARDSGRTVGYLLKYLCKEISNKSGDAHADGSMGATRTREDLGRVWGVHNRRCVPLASDRLVAVDAAAVLEALDRYTETFRCSYRLQSVSIFLTTEEAAALEQILRGVHEPPDL